MNNASIFPHGNLLYLRSVNLLKIANHLHAVYFLHSILLFLQKPNPWRMLGNTAPIPPLLIIHLLFNAMPPDKTHSLLLVEDQTLIAEGIAALLPTSYIIAFARNLQEMLALLEQQKFDLALLDMKMKDGNSGVRYMQQLQRKNTSVLIVASAISDVEMLHCQEMGALGYICKDDCTSSLQEAIGKSLAGQLVWTEQEIERIEFFKSSQPEVPKRFLKVLYHLMANPEISDQAIADSESLSTRTVRNYVSDLLELYGVTDRYQLKNLLSEMGYRHDLLPD